MAGYSWINQMDFTHPGTAAIGGYQNASKQRSEKKVREMAYLKDQAALDKLILEIAHLPKQQAADLELAQNKILTEQLTAMLKAQEAENNPYKFASEQGYKQAQTQAQQALAGKYNAQADEARRIDEVKNLSEVDLSEIPQNLREEMIAKANVYTGDTAESVKLFNLGYTLTDIVEVSGGKREDVKNIIPAYPTTTPMKTFLQKGQAFSAETQVLAPITAQYLGEYYDRFMANGYSVNQVKDAIFNQNEDKQAKFLAGTMLYPDVAALNARSLGLTPGVEIQKHLEDRALGNLKASTFGVTKEVWQKATILFQEATDLSNQIATVRGLNPNYGLQEKINKDSDAFKIYEEARKRREGEEIQSNQNEKSALPNIGIGTNTPVKDVLGIMRNIP